MGFLDGQDEFMLADWLVAIISKVGDIPEMWHERRVSRCINQVCAVMWTHNCLHWISATYSLLDLLEEILVQIGRRGEAAEAAGQEKPATLLIVGVGVPPHLIGQLGQNLIS